MAQARAPPPRRSGKNRVRRRYSRLSGSPTGRRINETNAHRLKSLSFKCTKPSAVSLPDLLQGPSYTPKGTGLNSEAPGANTSLTVKGDSGASVCRLLYFSLTATPWLICHVHLSCEFPFAAQNWPRGDRKTNRRSQQIIQPHRDASVGNWPPRGYQRQHSRGQSTSAPAPAPEPTSSHRPAS